MSVKVDCYAGYRGEETPRRLEIDGRHVEVVQIVNRWREPTLRCFRVRGDDGAVYLLRHDDATGEWDVNGA